jgi:hypothetical protein
MALRIIEPPTTRGSVRALAGEQRAFWPSGRFADAGPDLFVYV